MNSIINQFSPHLFWDVKKEDLEWEKSKDYIIKRVLEYGLYSDWQILKKQYGLDAIKASVINFRELEPKSVNMIAVLTNTSPDKFRCYNTTQLNNPHWNF